MTSSLTSQTQVVSAASFVVEFTGSPIGRMAFSELGGITSKVASQEYIFSDANGKVNHTKQFGKTEPPTISVKRGLDQAGSNAILAWHAFARSGDNSARCPGTLTVFDAGGTVQATYHLEEAWISEVNITSVKAGTSDVAMIECKITCASITGAGNR